MSELIEPSLSPPPPSSQPSSSLRNSLNNQFWVNVKDSDECKAKSLSLYFSSKLPIKRKKKFSNQQQSLITNIEQQQQQQFERRVHWNPFLVQLLRSSSPLNNLRCV